MSPAIAAAPPPLTDDAPHLLVVDDDNRIRTLLRRYLLEHGFRATVAEDAAAARRSLAQLEFDLIILDVMMPGESGVDLAASLRTVSDVPILMLTARAESGDRIAGLEAGVDDYLTKPFEPRELLLRVQSILRRRAPRTTGPAEVRFGPFTFHLQKMELTRGDAPVRLTERERRLLKAFAERPGDTIARHLLVEGEGGLGERTVDVQINRLRRKLEVDPANPVHLQTVRGIGYRLATS
jgi:two-component system phosphate regulon response regulator OmpR